MKSLVILALVSVLLVGPSQVVTAQPDAIPVTLAGSCTVEPMPQQHIDQLANQAATLTEPVTPAPIDLTQGQPVSDDVRAELSQVIQQAEACAQAQDLARLLSLYSDRFIVEQFFADEPIQIIPATEGTPAGGSVPEGATDQQDMLMVAVLLPDGRVAANVSSNAWGGDQRLHIFVEQDNHWLIDQIDATPGDFPVGGDTSVTIPAEAQSVVDLVLQDAATQLGIDPSTVTVTAIEAVDWPDSSLGCPEDGGVYAPVISPGYRITVSDGKTPLEYHTGPNDIIVACASS